MNGLNTSHFDNSVKSSLKDCAELDAVKDITAIITDLKETNKAIKDLEKRLEESVVSLRDKVPNEDQFTDVISHLYWRMPKIRDSWLAKAAFGTRGVTMLPKFVRKVSPNIFCLNCKTELHFSHKGKLHMALEALSNLEEGEIPFRFSEYVLCAKCFKTYSEEHWRNAIAANNAYLAGRSQEDPTVVARRTELRNMPYREYLRTPEWIERRNRHLRSAGYACQVCNASDLQLDVHHRTYVRRGNELYQDLLVLCRDCHGLFHKKRKLAD